MSNKINGYLDRLLESDGLQRLAEFQAIPGETLVGHYPVEDQLPAADLMRSCWNMMMALGRIREQGYSVMVCRSDADGPPEEATQPTEDRVDVAEGESDERVLALALACWWGEKRKRKLQWW